MGKAAGGMHFPLLDAIPILPLPDLFAVKYNVILYLKLITEELHYDYRST